MRRFLLGWLFACAFATAGASFPVCAAEVEAVSSDEGTVSGNDFSVVIPGTSQVPDINLTLSISDIMPLSSYDSYYGSISSTYLEYMRGFLSKLSPTAHYVGARVSQYDYLFAYGEELVYDGRYFSGAATVVRWRTDSYGSFSSGYDGNFELDPGNYLVYTDLTDVYPALATSSDFTLRQILLLFTIFCICLTVNSMYQVRKIRRLKRSDDVNV